MGAGRLTGLTDGVIAVIITIMVLEFAPPAGAALADLLPLVPVFLAYVLSFMTVGIYWNNHHHLLRATEQISAGVMWANLHFLLWLALVPFVTSWVGEHPGERWPTIVYGVVCLLTGLAYAILVRAILAANPGRAIVERLGRDRKSQVSVALYALGCIVAIWLPFVGIALFFCVTLVWFIPDRRLAR
jgi:uncharacterized membrane protein